MTDTLTTILPSIEQDAVRETNKFAPDDRAVHNWYRSVALFALEESENGAAISSERHYRLVASDGVTATDLALYRSRTE